MSFLLIFLLSSLEGNGRQRDKEKPEVLNDFHVSVFNGKCCSNTAPVEKGNVGTGRVKT